MSSLIMGRQRRGKPELSTLVDPTTMTGTEQLYPLGYEITVPGTQGSRETLYATWKENTGIAPATWVYVYAVNNCEANRAVGVFGIPGPGAPFSPRTANPMEVYSNAAFPWSQVVGVAQSEILQGEFGFVLRKGIGKGLFVGGATSVSVQAPLQVAGAGGGLLDTPAATTADGGFGYALEELNDASNFLVDIYVNCIG